MPVLTEEFLDSLPVYKNCDYRLINNSLSMLILQDGPIYQECLYNNIITVGIENNRLKITISVFNENYEDQSNDLTIIRHVLFSSKINPDLLSVIECYKPGIIVAVPALEGRIITHYARVENEEDRRNSNKIEPMPTYYSDPISWSPLGIRLATQDIWHADDAPATAGAYPSSFLMAIATLLWPHAPATERDAVRQQQIVRIAAARIWSAIFRAEKKIPPRVPQPLAHVPGWAEILSEADALFFGGGGTAGPTDLLGRLRRRAW